MKKALLFRENEEPIEVTADEVKAGLYSRWEEFVDPEYEFKVCYVKGARNNGGPYFRLYYSYEDYKRLYPDRASKYEIVADMRRYQESNWHKKWKKLVSDFCEIEKCIKNPSTNKRRMADAFYEKTKTCIEFQHSYIANDFEERNEFYSDLSIRAVWLYDLPKANVKQAEDGAVEILEDNARGFFRISENPDNLKKHPVYIQVKSGTIYRVTELKRRESSAKQKSTIRYFYPLEEYTEDEFVGAILNNTIGKIFEENQKDPRGKSLKELWKPNYRSMTEENVENGDEICINRETHGKPSSYVDELFPKPQVARETVAKKARSVTPKVEPPKNMSVAISTVFSGDNIFPLPFQSNCPEPVEGMKVAIVDVGEVEIQDVIRRNGRVFIRVLFLDGSAAQLDWGVLWNLNRIRII